MERYQTFSKNVNYVIDNNNHKIIVPYVEKARKRYRFATEEKILQKQCSKCEKWFEVMRLENGELIDIHNEDEIHLTKSGFISYCKKCTPKKLVSIKEGSDKRLNDSDKCSVYLTELQRRYLKMRAAAVNKPMKELLGEIIDDEIRKNPIGNFL